jgi:hypothetical protein
MQYGVLLYSDTKNSLPNYEELGQTIEMRAEEKGFHIELPTNADWGYVFRLQLNPIRVDVSIVQLSEASFGIAIEPVKSLLRFQSARSRTKAVDLVKRILFEILECENRPFTLEWYSDKQWRQTFHKGFWQPDNSLRPTWAVMQPGPKMKYLTCFYAGAVVNWF